MKKCLLLSVAVMSFATLHAQSDSATIVPTSVLTFFHVLPVDKVILLKWAPTGLEDYKSFDVERSIGLSNDFTKVGSKLAISKNSSGEYEFVDATPPQNRSVQYRLKLITKDGSFSYSELKEAKLAGKQMTVRLKQNPVQSRIETEVEVTKPGLVTYTIVSQSGQSVTSQSFRLIAGLNPISFPAQAFLAGLYQLVIESGLERKVISFVKE